MYEVCIALLKYRSRIAYRRVQNKIPVPYEDCLGEAYVIFCKALSEYDPDRGAQFKTYLSHTLRELEKKILYANRMSSIDNNLVPHPISSEFIDSFPDNKKRISTVELSDDGALVVSLLLNGTIGGDYGSGKGKKLPGKKRIPPYMKKHFGWKYKKTDSVIEEIKDWWRDQL